MKITHRHLAKLSHLWSPLLASVNPVLWPHCVFQVAKAVSHSLNNCVNCLPGQKDVDMALRSIGEASKKLLIDTVSLHRSGSVLTCFSSFVRHC